MKENIKSLSIFTATHKHVKLIKYVNNKLLQM